ncbi:hypothetical protein SDC9_195167 [bioreactor metagenome]|uniref:Uncharacterized protein n=1 Tax=bioreactor metagenome TaxID=1076179 RepID=A0A645IGY1_9ZZZZ
MAGLCRFDGDLGGFQIADFAHHDDVRILTQEGTQRRGEGQSGLLVDVDLVDAGQIDFRRILSGGDVYAGLVQHVQTGVQRNRLA